MTVFSVMFLFISVIIPLFFLLYFVNNQIIIPPATVTNSGKTTLYKTNVLDLEKVL